MTMMIDDDERNYDDASFCVMHPSSLLLLKVSPLAQFHKVNFFIGSFKTTDNKKREKKSTHQRKLHQIFYIRERERERERENEKTKTKKKRKDEFDEIRPTNAFMGRKRSEVTLVRENSGLGRRGDERGSGEESHLGWNLATDDVRFAETDGGRERLGE